MTSTTDTLAPTYAGAFVVSGTKAFAVRGTDASEHTTGLPVGIPVRLRPVDVPMTGLPLGAAGAIAVQLNSDTPGDLTPRVPPS